MFAYKLNEIQFTTPVYFENLESPLNQIFYADKTQEISNCISVKEALNIKCTFINQEGQDAPSGYSYGVKIIWKNGDYTGEIFEDLNSDDLIINIPLKKEDYQFLFTDVKSLITFQIVGFERNAEGIITYDEIFLDFNNGNNGGNALDFAEPPRIYNNGIIPQVRPNNKIKKVNYFNNTIIDSDFELYDIRIINVSNVPIYGIKAKVSLTEDNNIVKECDLNWFYQGVNILQKGDNNFFEINNDILLKSDEFDTTNAITFKSNILKKPDFIKNLIGIDNLEYLDDIKEFYYTISIIDIYGQESQENYTFKVGYDFGIEPYLQENPILKWFDIYEELTINNKNCALFCDYSNDGKNPEDYDWIIFEWFPAFNPNDYLKNKDKYYCDESSGKCYLLPNKEDLTNYRIYKNKTNGESTFLNLYSAAGDFMPFEVEIEIGEEKLKVIKYRGKYAMNLKDKGSSDLFTLSIVPYYNNKEYTILENSKVDILREKEKGKEIQYFFVNRFNKPDSFYLEDIVRKYNKNKNNGEYEYKIRIKNEDWGGTKKINGITPSSDMIDLKNLIIDSFFTGEIEVKLSGRFLKDEDGNAADYSLKKQYANEDLYLENGSLTEQSTGVSINLVYDFTNNITSLLRVEDTDSEIAAKIRDIDSTTFDLIITTTIKHTRYKFDSANWSITTGKEDIQQDIYTYHLSAAFSTLSLRKNKVGINISEMEDIEEALYIVAKNRIDSDNKEKNIASYDGQTFPHVLSIEGNQRNKMPDFNKADGKSSDTVRDDAIYIGLYNRTSSGIRYRMGSIGMEAGYPYLIYKGKYYRS